MLKYYAEANGRDGMVSYLSENIAHSPKIASALNTTADIRQRIFEMLEDICTELILKPGCEDDFDAIKTENAVLVFREGYGGKIFDFLPEPLPHLQKAGRIHDLWERIYIDATDFKKADRIAVTTAESLIPKTRGKGGKNINRFFGTLTHNGSVNFIDNLTLGFKRRIFIKGRPGTGKSTLLKAVRAAANDAGLDTETYHCSLDPASLDMVIIRDLSVCIFDSTPPHEKFPERGGDEVLDMYALTVKPGTDEENSHKLKEYSRLYTEAIKKARECLTPSQDMIYETVRFIKSTE